MSPQCLCAKCAPNTFDNMRMILCQKCGNKRCPHAVDHDNACTGSNAPGQKGSAYEHSAAPLETEAQTASHPRDCKHGKLARSCDICELERDLAAMTAERDALQAETAMPDKGHCKCKFSSGGVLSKWCAFHKEILDERDALRHDVERLTASLSAEVTESAALRKQLATARASEREHERRFIDITMLTPHTEVAKIAFAGIAAIQERALKEEE